MGPRMRPRLLAILVPLLVALPFTLLSPPVQASPADEYSGPYFGDGNLPPGCVRDMSPTNPDNICYHMRTDMNGLDSPQVDVVVMVPVSPTAERDMRIMRQSVEMWEAGIDYMADQMDLGWLADGMDFHITVDYFDPAGEAGGEFTTYPIVDPEIVVIATNPAGGAGIGVDPVDFVGNFEFTDEDAVPCHGVSNPFDFEYWDTLPGFNNHHESRTGTYVEDCNGAGGNICFAINGAIDPAPETIDFFGLFDLVSHEFGHCLTIGHVGDGAEGAWGALPSNDIMAYSQDPPGLHKCVSSLDVEGIATQMSKYLDVNGDEAVGETDRLLANDQVGDGSSPFQVQHPDDHLYASSTGSPLDCPQPDLGLVPGERTEWTPTPVSTSQPVLTLTSPQAGGESADGAFDVTGTVERISTVVSDPDPTATTGAYDDADDDASSPLTEIQDLDVEVTETHVDATIRVEQLWPSTSLASPTSYSLTIDGRKFDSFIRYAVDTNPMTWDNGAKAYMGPGASTWDIDAGTVSFHIPRDHLTGASIVAPYYVGSAANFGLLSTAVIDDSAPEIGASIGLAGARVADLHGVKGVANTQTVDFQDPDGNTFYAEQSTLGVTGEAGLDPSHAYSLHLGQPSNVEFLLTWTDGVGGSDLDLRVTGAANSGSDGATAAHPETFILAGVAGRLDITVEPYLITDPIDGVTYTLTATVTPLDPGPDTDGDGVPDSSDACPNIAGAGAKGCPIQAVESVHVYVDGVLAASQDVDTANGPDSFATAIQIAEGVHEVRVDWERRGKVIASETRNVSRPVTTDDGGPDFDGDGVPDAVDNCADHANADQADMDGDRKGDVCDSDLDGDGHSNGKERAHGTDPADPSSYPRKGTSGR